MASERQIQVGGVPIGGGAPVVVQTMTKPAPADLSATMDQIRRVADAGADVVRVAVPREKCVDALSTIVRESPIPVIADIHFNYTLALKALDAVHLQGGICLIPHPLSWLTRSIGRHGIERILARRAEGLWFDGIELSNQSPAGRVVAERVQRLNRSRFHLPAAGGSDAHYLPIVGTSYTVFPGSGLEGLRRALRDGTSHAECGETPSLADLGYGQVLRQSWRGLWATPRRVLRLPRQ